MNQPSLTPAQAATNKLVHAILESADDRKAADPIALDVADISYLADYFIILTGFSRTQVRAICDSIEQKVESEFSRSPIRLEGKQDSSWILIDYGSVIVHIFLPTEREFYNLEAFWGHATKLPLAL
jgi:ribosome-associated protein